MSKVKCFVSHKFRHFSSQCPNKKTGKGNTATATIAQMEMAEKFEKNFSLVSCLSGIVKRGVWFVDSSACHHMTKSQDLFTNMTKGAKDVNVGLVTRPSIQSRALGVLSSRWMRVASWR